MPQGQVFRGVVRAKVQGLEANIDLLSRLDHPNIVRYLVRRRHRRRRPKKNFC